MGNGGDSAQFSIEFLNAIEICGLPPHTLHLKGGMPIMLMRSWKPLELINGTRCVVVDCSPNVAEVEIAVGAHKGKWHFTGTNRYPTAIQVPVAPVTPVTTPCMFCNDHQQSAEADTEVGRIGFKTCIYSWDALRCTFKSWIKG
ncbi:hypothetical protein ElyMa_001444700 [Elysia marginata]|uniref:DNA helicase Pif1-like 2B domain-containing protein n=1 Tax=Elysia marginata TaxID=1093978 RepID=A0AAV4J058_9GAST|nr:hypothetical protein ElyMa_001444700 [Elysia marginata]